MYEPGTDAPRVKRTGRRLNVPSFVQAIVGMQTGRTVPELVEFTGLHAETIRAICKAMVLAEQAHICGWEQDSLGRDTTPRYRLGWGVNVPRKLKKTNNTRSGSRDRRTRLRKQANAINDNAAQAA